MSVDKYPEEEAIVYIFTQSEENNCFSMITRLIIRTTAFSFILFVSFSKGSRNRTVAIVKIKFISVLITWRGVP